MRLVFTFQSVCYSYLNSPTRKQNSGATGLFTVTVSGAPLLTGGDFGLEGSIVPVMVSLLIAIPMLIAASRNRASSAPRK